MGDYVIRAMARWPDVPAVYGWLALDIRGDWRIKGERLGQRKFIDYVNRNYAADDSGCWFFQNGPQRVFVRLEYTPWVYRLGANHDLYTHTQERVGSIDGVYLDDDGNLLLNTLRGVGHMDHRDLVAFSALLDLDRGGADAERIAAAVTETQSGRPSDLVLSWGGRILEVRSVTRTLVASLFGFNPNPESRIEERW